MIPSSTGLRSRKKQSTSVVEKLQVFDVHPKIETSVQEKSISGAFVSLFAVAVILFLLWEESTVFLKPMAEEMLFVDLNRSDSMNIFLDITFYRLKCSDVAVDSVDYNGEQQNGITHNIVKSSINYKGEVLAEGVQDELGSYDIRAKMPDDYCGSCYGARPAGQCCNSCEDVKKAFAESNRAMSLAESSMQCLRDKKLSLPGENGCRIRGHLNVNKIKGNFHIAGGSSHPQQHGDHQHHIHHVNRTELANFDISHYIHHLAFGEMYPGIVLPLNGTEYISDKIGMHTYYITLVPTQYQTIDGQLINTNQFSVYDYFGVSHLNDSHFSLPGVFFSYDFWPMRIKYTEQSKPILPFLTRLCAVLGGMYVVCGLIYNTTSRLVSLIRKTPKSSSS